MKNTSNNQAHVHEGFHALLIGPPSQSSHDLVETMEVTIQNLVLDAQHPVALEVASVANKPEFIIRATTQAALDHCEASLRAEYPQIEIRPLREKDDPFRLDSHEAVSAVELMAEEKDGAYSHPFKGSRRGSKDERDPLLRLLAVLSKLPDHTRAIVQIGLAPVSSTVTTGILSSTGILGITKKLGNTGFLGSTSNLGNTGKLGSTFGVDAISVLAVVSSRQTIAILATINTFLLLILARLLSPLFPGWLFNDLGQLIAWGQFPAVTPGQSQQLIWCIVAFLLVEVLFIFGTVKVIQRFFLRSQSQISQAPVSDTASAYRTRIRFYVIGPKPPDQETKKFPDFIIQSHSPTEKEQEGVLLRMIAAYRQFQNTSGIAFTPKQIPARTAHLLLHQWQQGLSQSSNLVSFHGLATLWHLPQERQLSELGIQGKRTRTLTLPDEVADQSAGQESTVSPLGIGYSEHGGSRLPFCLPASFFSHHTLIAGKSGEGKSAFMRHLGHCAMARGGLILVDPYGDLCEDVLKIVPPDRAEEVVFIDLSDSTASIGLNLLDVTLGRGRDKTISDLLKMLVSIWGSNWGSKMEIVFEMSLRTLFEANKVLVAQNPQDGPRQQYTLLDISPLLTNANFCHSVLQLVQDDYLQRWWREYYEPLSFAQQRDVINPLITKVAKFESTNARRIVGQAVSTLNIAQMIAEKKIILLKLAKGIVGDDVASLVGATILGLVQVSLVKGHQSQGMSRSSKLHLPIIIDGFEMLLGSDYEALAELRKYGATLFLSCQSLEYIQKLNSLLLSTVQANVKQLIAFHMSAQDAELLHKELEVDRDDLVHLDMHSCYAAILAADRRQPTFSLTIAAPPKADDSRAESIRTRCRIHYTCPVDEIDQMLRDAMIRTIRHPLPQEEEHGLAELSLGTSSNTFASPKTRLLKNDTQRLPFTRELNTGELGSRSREMYRSRIEDVRARREKERKTRALSEDLDSGEGRGITRRLNYAEDKEAGDSHKEEAEP